MKDFSSLRGMIRSRKVTIVLAAICCLSLIVAFLVGISGNPPGLFLCYIAAAALILALVHNWRKTKKFLILSGASLIGFPVFVILHNVFYALGEMASNIVVLSHLLELLHVVFFLIAIFVCPTGFLIGAVGSIIVYFISRKNPVEN